jgi:uncharacterized membrane protein YesL
VNKSSVVTYHAKHGTIGHKAMDILNSKLYRSIEILISFLLLNLMWILLSFPVVSAFPATAAMFGVVREWIRGTDSGAIEPFFRHLKANFIQSFVIGLIWIVLGAMLVADFFLLEGAEMWVKVPLLLLLALGGLCYTFTAIYIFPVMVNYENDWRRVIKNSFLISISQLGTTLLCIFVCALMLLVVLSIPIAGLLAGSVTAYAVYSLCKRAFSRIEAAKEPGR